METEDAVLLKYGKVANHSKQNILNGTPKYRQLLKKYCKHKTRKSCLKVVRLRKARRQIKIEMTKEKEEDKLSYIKKKRH